MNLCSISLIKNTPKSQLLHSGSPIGLIVRRVVVDGDLVQTAHLIEIEQIQAIRDLAWLTQSANMSVWAFMLVLDSLNVIVFCLFSEFNS